MIRAIQLIFTPFEAWTKIVASQRGFLGTLFLFLVPMILAAAAAEGYALMRWGESRSELGYVVKASQPAAIRYAASQAAALLASVFVASQFLLWIVRSFQMGTRYAQCFVLIAYGSSPILLARYFDCIPALSTWLCWGIGALLTASTLYHGVGLVLKPEQTKGFGLYLVGWILVVLASGLGHLVALTILRGRGFDL